VGRKRVFVDATVPDVVVVVRDVFGAVADARGGTAAAVPVVVVMVRCVLLLLLILLLILLLLLRMMLLLLLLLLRRILEMVTVPVAGGMGRRGRRGRRSGWGGKTARGPAGDVALLLVYRMHHVLLILLLFGTVRLLLLLPLLLLLLLLLLVTAGPALVDGRGGGTALHDVSGGKRIFLEPLAYLSLPSRSLLLSDWRCCLPVSINLLNVNFSFH